MTKLTIKAARVNAGYSQKAAAKELKISNKTLCGWEKGKSAPSVHHADAMCKLYGVSYDDVIFLRSNPL